MSCCALRVCQFVKDAGLYHQIQARRTTYRYYRAWQRAYGRSMVLMSSESLRNRNIRDLLKEVAAAMWQYRRGLRNPISKDMKPDDVEAMHYQLRLQGIFTELVRQYFKRPEHG